MKKTVSVILKISAGLVFLILIMLFTIPVLFKEKIRAKVEQAIAGSLNATVKFEDYKLGFFRNFPNLSFSLTGLSVVGVDKFENDTLVASESLSLVFNLASLFGKSGYEVKSIVIDKATMNAIVLKDGSVNWDIVKDTTETSSVAGKEEPSSLKILLRKVSVINSSMSYADAESDIQVYMNSVDLIMRGDMTMSETDLQISGRIGEFTYIMEGMKYLNKTVIDAKIDMLANLDTWKFTFRENYLSVNDMKLNFTGYVAMPGSDIETDISFKTAQTSFSSLLSLIPAVYMNDYQDIKTAGQFELKGSAKGVYSDADSTMPDLSLDLSVVKGSLSYPSLPEQIRNVNIKSTLFVDGKDMDKTTVYVDRFHFELAGSPFDISFELKTPISDPDFKCSLAGHIDLSALSRALPLDSIALEGIIDMSVDMGGRMSAMENARYEDFKASGKITIQNMVVNMSGYPEVKVSKAVFGFAPPYIAMTHAGLIIGGGSDFILSGIISNYIPYLFKDKTIISKLSLHSKLVDMSGIMSQFASDTTVVKDTTSLTLIKIPANVDFVFDAAVDEFRYGTINGQNLKGHIIVKDGILSLRETGMNILNGTMAMNADYDTRDTLKPSMKADMNMQNIEVKDAFNTFNSVKKLAPAAKGIDGKISVSMAFQSLLGRDMMPVVSTINGEGKLKSDEITLVESETFDKMKELLKLGDKYKNTFRDVNVSFKISDGRIFISPFDIRTGNLKMNISGDQGIDQTINYFVKTEMPRSDLGESVNALIDNLAAQAAAFGISYKPSEIIKVNLKVTGTFTNPAISPVFGNSSAGSGTAKESMTKEVTKRATDMAKEKARAEAEKQAAQLVKEAEEKGQLMRDEAAKAADAIRKEADLQAKKLIDDSEKKSSLEKMAAQKGAESLKKNADKKAAQLVKEADVQATKLVEEAKIKGDELIKKI
ncbi:MAG: hypothetical protein IPJ37_24740 [Bacteroidales bacterium]|nr:hypothetical protein [Bacteroidales bacterium]